MKNINITGARLHNLKDINISIPKNKLIAVTGVSGSGKSTLVFDIIFEEGRRQYLQSLGILSKVVEENKFDHISGLAPAIAVQQSIIRQSNPRSTVGSRTQILSMLSVLYVAEGQIHCSSCHIPVDNNLTCKKCGYTEERLDVTYFSYNAPNGMCMTCSGRGGYFEINMEKLVPNEETTVQQLFDSVGVTPGYQRLLRKQFESHMDSPFSQLPDEVKDEIIHGHYVTSNAQNRSYCLTRIFEARLQKYGEDLSGVYTMAPCSACQGYRVGEDARHVLLHGKHIGELGQMTIAELHAFFEHVQKQHKLTPFGENLLNEIMQKTNNLLKARLGHLSLYREMPTLSGGEIQRLFLNSHLDSKMDSLIYILDEPTVGLHESEKAALLKSIKALKELGNTVIVVEHDKHTIEMADHVIDIGPKAGIEGGKVVYQGDLAGLLQSHTSLTGQYLSGKLSMPNRINHRKGVNDKSAPHLTVYHAQTNNLKDVTASFPLGTLVGVAGVSGSGKSSLISNTLIPLLKRYFNERPKNGRLRTEEKVIDGEMETAVILPPLIANKLVGAEHLSGYAEVSQAPIGRNMNSNPITYIGIWDKIRRLFAEQPEAIQQNLSAGHFSFNSKGACSVCGGSGRETIRLSGNMTITNICNECQGKRYNDEALSIRYKGKNIADILDMSVAEAVPFFEDKPRIISTLRILQRIGMGYIKLGQPTPTLSGGEAQRIKLAKEIGKRRKGNILYVLDEPTTGLSLYDTAKLIELLDELVTQGNSVIVVEHDTAVLSSCDWLIELGPKGGAEGGHIIAVGSPRDLKQNEKSVTGGYLS